MTGAEFGALLKKGISGGFLFYGEETYLKHRYLEAVRKEIVPDPTLDAFNRYRFDERSYDPDALRGAISSFPMMAEKKLIELHSLPLSQMKSGEMSELTDALSSIAPDDGTVLILYTEPEEFDPGTPKRPSSLFKTLSGILTPVLFDRETPARLNKWITQHFAAEGVFASSDLALRLTDYVGKDMYALSGQIEKLAAYVRANGRDHLTDEDITLVACRYREPQAFDFANAILDGNLSEALSLLSEKKLRKEPPEIILSGVSTVFCDLLTLRLLYDNGCQPKEMSAKTGMHEYRVNLYLRTAVKKSASVYKKALSLCADADLRIKSTPLDPYVLLDRLVVETATLR
ncbi:MAG: DNA polymerase III subunit delta [Lachnospiraceae bacterium]|nr:DNA polymerase III subunit delta [Lachnospiraceae bacterium]